MRLGSSPSAALPRLGSVFKRPVGRPEAVPAEFDGNALLKRQLRRPGAAALDLCYVAAGSLMSTEAGSLIGNFTGESDFLDQREVVAGAPKIYGQLVQLLTPYTRVIKEGEPAAMATPAEPVADATSALIAAAAPAVAVPRPAARIRKADAGAK